jgi:hypothetical protein
VVWWDNLCVEIYMNRGRYNVFFLFFFFLRKLGKKETKVCRKKRKGGGMVANLSDLVWAPKWVVARGRLSVVA